MGMISPPPFLDLALKLGHGDYTYLVWTQHLSAADTEGR